MILEIEIKIHNYITNKSKKYSNELSDWTKRVYKQPIKIRKSYTNIEEIIGSDKENIYEIYI